MRLEDDVEEFVTLDVAAAEAVASPKTSWSGRMRNHLSGQIRNQVRGPYSQRLKTSQRTVVIRM